MSPRGSSKPPNRFDKIRSASYWLQECCQCEKAGPGPEMSRVGIAMPQRGDPALQDRDGCPKIVNLGTARTDLFYERKKRAPYDRYTLRRHVHTAVYKVWVQIAVRMASPPPDGECNVAVRDKVQVLWDCWLSFRSSLVSRFPDVTSYYSIVSCTAPAVQGTAGGKDATFPVQDSQRCWIA